MSLLPLITTILLFTNILAEPPNKCSTGHSQSPVNVNLYKVRPKHFPPLFWSFDYFEPLNSLRIMVTQSTVRLEMNKTHAPILSEGPLGDYYRLDQIHFHWGANDRKGSEHTVDKKKYSMEMHAVHTKADLTFDEAVLLPDGIVVLGYLIEPETHHHHYPSSSEIFFQEITNVFPKISPNSRERTVRSKLSLVDLVVPFTYDYLTYRGSLTTEPCDESVIWILSPMVLKITQDQLQAFRDLYYREITQSTDNWRPTQPLNGRKIYRSTVPYHNFLDIHDQCRFNYNFETPDDYEDNVIGPIY